MNRNLRIALAVFGLGLLALIVAASRAAALDPPEPLPPFHSQAPQDWLNSEPLSVEQLRGKVVLIDVWTFGCWNCYRSFPWLNGLEERFADRPFQVLGIHTPEFDHEKDRARVAAKIREFELDHPVLIDNEFRYWRALGNRYWPSFYLVDKQGNIRYRFVGETHAGDRRAGAIERAIRDLLAE